MIRDKFKSQIILLGPTANLFWSGLWLTTLSQLLQPEREKASNIFRSNTAQ